MSPSIWSARHHLFRLELIICLRTLLLFWNTWDELVMVHLAGQCHLAGWTHIFVSFLQLSQQTGALTSDPKTSLVDLITTLINIYTAQGGHWSVTAKITVIVIGLCTGNVSVLYLVYNHWILEKMKTPSPHSIHHMT
jgi:hypothetical protein